MSKISFHRHFKVVLVMATFPYFSEVSENGLEALLGSSISNRTQEKRLSVIRLLNIIIKIVKSWSLILFNMQKYLQIYLVEIRLEFTFSLAGF